MLLASGHHRIMAAARGALVMMVLGKVVFSRPRRSTRPMSQWVYYRLAWVYIERGWSDQV